MAGVACDVADQDRSDPSLPTVGDAAASEARVRRIVASLGVEHEIVPCDEALADTAAFCAAYGYSPEDSANTIVVAGKADPPRHAVCVLLATTRLDVNRTVRARLGTRKASFAGAEETRAITGMAIGGVTPFGLDPALPLWIDAAVMARGRIVLGGGSRACKVVGPPELLLRLPGAEVVEGLAVPAIAGLPAGSDVSELSDTSGGQP
jgi:prolyl-tRNA editing enzyme YbaK/EbsC (Cys-tRNA(Pro) deacylase)